MSYLIRDLPDDEKPRERFIQYGVEALSNEELLSILLRTGTKNKSVKELSTDLLKEISFYDLCHINYKALSKIKGIGDVKAITILTAIELGKRVGHYSEIKVKIKDCRELYEYVRLDFFHQLQERFMVIYLDNKSCVLMKKILFIGTVNYSLVVARDIFREGVKCNATSMIMVHNHPSGNVFPSSEDIYLTEKIIYLGKMMEIQVVEHMIIGDNSYYSLRTERGDLFGQK